MALYAFDGTGNEDNENPGLDSNVRKFFEAHANPDAMDMYLAGVGTRWGWLGKLFGGLTGAGGKARVSEAMTQLGANFRAGDRTIDIVGFSRGAALALDFANQIHDEGAVTIRFLGLWDTVASFGIPGNNINLSYDVTLPPNVDICRHALSLDERRFAFPLTRVIPEKFSGVDLQDAREVWFRGYHSDVGGGNENPGLSNIALYWMLCEAQAAGLKFDASLVGLAERGRNPGAAPKTPSMDQVANAKRAIRGDDYAHISVSRMHMAGRFRANNPPMGLAVVGDAA